MMIDSPKSQLFALGVPKGKTNKQGKVHRFYDLYQQSENPIYHCETYSSYMNPLISASDIEALEKEISRMNPEMVQQEIYGQFVDGAFNAIFDYTNVELFRVNTCPTLGKIVVAVDPAISNTSKSDETGIIVLGMDYRGHIYVLEDITAKYSPAAWAKAVVGAFTRWKANEVVAESNQGGDMVKSTIQNIAPSVPVVSIHASRGKDIRAEPVAMLYDEGKAHHVGRLTELESEMVSWQGLNGQKSPNRIDALVHGVNRLMQGNNGYKGFVV
jgi:phage terminase large subunit-like protein